MNGYISRASERVATTNGGDGGVKEGGDARMKKEKFRFNTEFHA